MVVRFYQLYFYVFLFQIFLIELEATLSMMLNTGLKPLFVKYVMFYFKVAIVNSSFKFKTGIARVELDDQSYSTKMAVFPSIELIGNFPVKST